MIQTVVLAEFQGVTRPSALGEKPFLDNDPARPNEKYFDRVREIVDEAASDGLYVALVPSWGDKLTAPWGDGPRLVPFFLTNLPVAHSYARYLAEKLKSRTNVMWILGGDRPPKLTSPSKSAQAAGFPGLTRTGLPFGAKWPHEAGGTEAEEPLVLYHPQGGGDSSLYLTTNLGCLSTECKAGPRNGHDVPVWEWIAP